MTPCEPKEDALRGRCPQRGHEGNTCRWCFCKTSPRERNKCSQNALKSRKGARFRHSGRRREPLLVSVCPAFPSAAPPCPSLTFALPRRDLAPRRRPRARADVRAPREGSGTSFLARHPFFASVQTSIAELGLFARRRAVATSSMLRVARRARGVMPLATLSAHRYVGSGRSVDFDARPNASESGCIC